MRFHGIDMRGKFWIHRVSSIASHPHSGDTTDEGRMVYDTTAEKLYIGTSTGWKEVTLQPAEGTSYGNNLGSSGNPYSTIYATLFSGTATSARYS